MKRLFLLSVLFAVCVSSAPAFAVGLLIIEDPSWWPGPNPPHPHPPHWPPQPLPPPSPHIFAPLEVSFVKATANIHDQVAVTSVHQEFYNPNDARLEGTFVFPIPKDAHLDKFTMEIDGKTVEAELLSAEKARHMYEEIVRKMRDPALLEYAGLDIFKVRIFPIEPHSKKHISLSYTQLLKSDSGLVSYMLPLNTEKFSAKPLKNVSVKVELETKRSLKSIYSPSHTVEIKREGPNRATAGYEAADVQPSGDFTLYFAPEKDEIGVNLLAHKTAGEDGYFLLLASPGVDVKEKQVISRDIAFVLDTSGSMAGKKLEQAKKALAFCIENLNDSDRFEVLRFSTEVEPLFDKLVEAGKQNRSRAEDFVKDLRAIGGTAIDDALRKALALQPSTPSPRPFTIVFLTDGQPTVGTTSEDSIVANVRNENSNRTRVFCFGIGTDVNTHLLDKIAEETRAFSQYVLPEEDLEVKVSNFYSKIKEPVLANPVLSFTGDVHATKLYPSPLPDLFKGEQLVLVGRYSGSGASAAQIEGAVNGASRKFAYAVKFPESSSENDFIPRLWATRRVGYLLDEIRLHGENSELRGEATELARKYGIVTPYTAYLILEDERRRDVPLAMRSLQNFDGDHAARAEAASTWDDFKTKNGGIDGLANARYGSELKNAYAAAPASIGANLESQRALGLSLSTLNPGGERPREPLADSAKSRLYQYSQQAQFTAGKNFFQNNNQWIDSAVQQYPKAKRVRIQFASPEYFDLVANNAKARPWLAQGANVQFVLDGTIYETYE